MNELKMNELKKTPLHDDHVSRNGRMVDFAGWHMPVQYVGVIEEHLSVRKDVGLFDVSHMGEIIVQGDLCLPTLQWLTSNDVSKLNNGQAQYSLLLNESGGLVDDIIVYCLEKNQKYLVCVNASNSDKDFAWMLKHNKGAEILNESHIWSQIAVQGPKAVELTARILGSSVREIKYFEFKEIKSAATSNQTWIVARTGYTGEDGYEVFLPNSCAPKFWSDLLEKGKDLNVAPIGLAARDTLRVEMKYSLYGHEITDSTPALEAGLGWVVKMQKPDFLGKAALEMLKSKGLEKKLIGFKMMEKGIPRQDYLLASADNNVIGKVTSGTMSPLLKEGIGIGYVQKEFSDIGKEIFVQIRGRNLRAVVVETPFVRPTK
jgi:aminomethyltransferase